MSIFRYLTSLLVVLFHHGIWWWVTLAISFIVSGGIGPVYQLIYARYGTWVQDTFGYQIPLQLSWWFFALLVLCWLFVSTLHKEIRRRQPEPRLYFELPKIVTTFLVEYHELGSDKYEICLASVRVRNNPIDRQNSLTLANAFSKAEFTNLETNSVEITVEYPRWTDNPKPRLDQTPTTMRAPKYLPDHNFRSIAPNNAPNRIDFAVKKKDDAFFHGFRGRGQQKPIWQEEKFKLMGKHYMVNLSIEGEGTNKVFKQKYFIENPGAGKFLKISNKRLTKTNWRGLLKFIDEFWLSHYQAAHSPVQQPRRGD